MANAIKYTATVEHGKLKIVNRPGFDSDMAAYFEGQRITLSVARYQKKRSNGQNGYYWAVVVPSVRDGLIDMGFERRMLDSDTVHQMLREKFLTVEVGNPDGEYIKLVRSTTELTTTEFMDYVADIQQWASEFLGVVIPEPGEQAELNF